MNSTPVSALPPAGASLAHLRRETGRFVELAARSPLQAHVPAYPAFTVETLSAHIGRALRIFRTIFADDPHEQDDAVQAPEGPAVIEWAAAGLEPLLALLSEVPPDKLVTFPHGAGQRPAALIAPLLAVEIGVHRWDLESVLGEHIAIPPDLAISEVDSVFENFVPRLASSGVAPIGGVVHLQAADAAVSWRVSVQDGRLLAGRASDEHDEPAVTVSAAAEDLALIVWKRWPPPRPGVEILGSADVLNRFLSVDYIPDPRTTPAH
jgi:uncharacterized protein (TIGR03083 family)